MEPNEVEPEHLTDDDDALDDQDAEPSATPEQVEADGERDQAEG